MEKIWSVCFCRTTTLYSYNIENRLATNTLLHNMKTCTFAVLCLLITIIRTPRRFVHAFCFTLWEKKNAWKAFTWIRRFDMLHIAVLRKIEQVLNWVRLCASASASFCWAKCICLRVMLSHFCAYRFKRTHTHTQSNLWFVFGILEYNYSQIHRHTHTSTHVRWENECTYLPVSSI